jgi:hypothetical protein
MVQRKFEETNLTKLFVAGLKSYIENLIFTIEHPEVYSGSINQLREELQNCEDILQRIFKEKLDVRFVSRDF